MDRIETLKIAAAGIRDKLRDEVDDLNAVIESITEGIEQFDSGRRELEAGVDKMSEYI